MNKAIRVSREGPRGCGFRKVGGLYLVDDKPGRECGRLPIPCEVCSCCGRGIKPARGWTWVDGDEILRASPECPYRESGQCEKCAVHNFVRHGVGKVGLIWIGEKFYPTTDSYLREVDAVGDSRRIKAVPHGFKIGETHVFLGHRKAIINFPEEGGDVEFTPGIFRIIKPDKIEVIVSGEESDEEIDALVKRGLSPVLVERVEDTQDEMELS